MMQECGSQSELIQSFETVADLTRGIGQRTLESKSDGYVAATDFEAQAS